MHIAHIAPTSALRGEVFKQEPFHMIIASQVLKDGAYADFYRNIPGFKVLDVPTFEEKSSDQYSLDFLREVIERVKPDEIVLPDGWNITGDENVKMAEHAAFELAPSLHKWGVSSCIAVPHASCLEEYLECAIRMVAIPEVKTIGVAERVEIEFEVTREFVVAELKQVLPNTPLHLLGCLRDLSDIGYSYVRHAVRSMDTVKFVRWGLDCLRPTFGNLPKYPGRGNEYFERNVNNLQLSYITRNILYWNKFCNHSNL